jgi:hypothetical protein
MAMIADLVIVPLPGMYVRFSIDPAVLPDSYDDSWQRNESQV